MNVLIISQYFWPESFRINDLAEGLIERGHAVTVLTGKPNYPGGRFFNGYTFLNKSKEMYGNIRIIRSPLVPRGKNRFRLALNYLSFVVFASIVGVFKCKRPDVILVYEPSPITVALPAIFFKKIKKVPILFWVQDLWPESVVAVDGIRSRKILKALGKLVHFIYARCDYILTTSQAYFDSIRKYNVSELKLRYFPQTCEAFYQPIADSATTHEETMLPKGFRIIFSGNIGIAQDVENSLRAANLLKAYKDIKWIFLGDGSRRIWLQNEIERQGLNETVFWLGQHSAESMPRFFACADALLVTLKSDPVFSLTIPAKIQSYLACAKPIIAALEGEGKRVIEEANAGLTTTSGNSAALAEIVMNMYKLSAHKRVQMGLEGRKYFEEHFQRDILLQKLESWMWELKEQNTR